MEAKRTKQFNGIINSPTHEANMKLYNDFIKFSKTYCSECFSIVHDKCIKETEEAKTWHFHFVIKTNDIDKINTNF